MRVSSASASRLVQLVAVCRIQSLPVGPPGCDCRRMAAQRGACPQLVPLLSVAVAGRQAALRRLVRPRSWGSGETATAMVFLSGALRLARRHRAGGCFRASFASTRSAGTAVEKHLTRLPGTRHAEDLHTPRSLSPPVLELLRSFRYAPPGLVAALANVLGLPEESEPLARALGEDPEAVLTWKARQRAQAGPSAARLSLCLSSCSSALPSWHQV